MSVLRGGSLARRAGTLAVGLAAVAIVVVVVVVHEWPAGPVDVTPVHPEAIRLSDGSFRGVHLGEGTKDILRTLGRPVRWGEFPSPTGASGDEELPSGPGDTISLDYRDFAVRSEERRVGKECRGRGAGWPSKRTGRGAG